MIKQTDTRYRKDFYYYKNDLYIGRSIELYGEYGQPEIDLLLALITERSIVFDIGANIGYYTNAFASKAKHVIAFEPNPQHWQLLAKNIEGLSNVYAMNAAIGDKTGRMKCSNFDPEVLGNFGNIKVGEEGEVEVPVISLDDFKDFPDPDLVKIDVEGMEYKVLMGMRSMIERRRPALYYEAHETKELPEIYDFLKPLDYNLYWASIPNYNPRNWKNNQENIYFNSVLVGTLAWPKSLGEIQLPEVLDRDDTPFKLLERNRK